MRNINYDIILEDSSHIYRMKEHYKQKWYNINENYIISKIFKIWYNVNESDEINFVYQIHYQFTGPTVGEWIADFTFNTTSYEWSYEVDSGYNPNISPKEYDPNYFILIQPEPENNFMKLVITFFIILMLFVLIYIGKILSTVSGPRDVVKCPDYN